MRDEDEGDGDKPTLQLLGPLPLPQELLPDPVHPLLLRLAPLPPHVLQQGDRLLLGGRSGQGGGQVRERDEE